MHIAILSGKGGTGKTTVAVNLAATLGCRYVDCDVEAPNGFLFLQPEILSTETVSVMEPLIDAEKCALCGACAEHCQFNALLAGAQGVISFPKLCHGCGLCVLVCPQKAISERQRPIGRLEGGQQGELSCWRGILDVGEPMAGPVIDALKSKLDDSWTILDSPPGSSCSVVATAQDTDLALLVTEPTPFGLHDLDMVAHLVKKMAIPAAIVINRSQGEDEIITEYAAKAAIPVLAKLPFSLEAARAYARGQLLIEQPEWLRIFQKLGQSIKELMSCDS